MDTVDLPQLWIDENAKEREEKSFRVPFKYLVSDVIKYIYETMDLKKHCAKSDADPNDATANLELLMKSTRTAPENE